MWTVCDICYQIINIYCAQVINMRPDVTYATRHSWSKMGWQWAGGGQLAKGLRQHKSRLCPESVRVKRLSNLCPNSTFLLLLWTACDICYKIIKIWQDQVINMWPSVTYVTRHSWSKLVLWWAGGGRWASGIWQHKSKPCPESVCVKRLSNTSPFSIFLLSKAQNVNPGYFFPSPKYVKKLSREEKCHIFNLFGQTFDNLWIFLSKLFLSVF